MILAGQLLLQSDASSSDVQLVPGWVRVHDGEIAEVVTNETPDRWDLGGKDHLICPGFIDIHLHLPQFDMMGAHGMPLMDWLGNVTFPAEQKWEDPDYAAAMMNRVVDQCFRVGTTSICAYATVHGPSTRIAMQIAQERGIGGVIGQVLMDRNAPDSLLRPMEEQLDDLQQLLQSHPPGGRLAAAVTPRFAVSCTAEMMRSAGELAGRHGAVIQTHLAETVRECEMVSSLFQGATYTQTYLEAGLLSERTILGHAIHLSETELRTLVEHECVIAHCPTANSFLRSGTMPRHQHVAIGIRGSLGSDIGAGYERSMVRVGRAMIEAAASLGTHYPSASQAWWMITHGNQSALGWDGSDRIKVGEVADLLVIQPDIPWLESDVDPLSMLMFAWDDRWLKKTLVDGRLGYDSQQS